MKLSIPAHSQEIRGYAEATELYRIGVVQIRTLQTIISLLQAS